MCWCCIETWLVPCLQFTTVHKVPGVLCCLVAGEPSWIHLTCNVFRKIRDRVKLQRRRTNTDTNACLRVNEQKLIRRNVNISLVILTVLKSNEKITWFSKILSLLYYSFIISIFFNLLTFMCSLQETYITSRHYKALKLLLTWEIEFYLSL